MPFSGNLEIEGEVEFLTLQKWSSKPQEHEMQATWLQHHRITGRDLQNPNLPHGHDIIHNSALVNLHGLGYRGCRPSQAICGFSPIPDDQIRC